MNEERVRVGIHLNGSTFSCTSTRVGGERRDDGEQRRASQGYRGTGEADTAVQGVRARMGMCVDCGRISRLRMSMPRLPGPYSTLATALSMDVSEDKLYHEHHDNCMV